MPIPAHAADWPRAGVGRTGRTASALRTAGWLPLTGPGGIGKTRLALAVAADQSGNFAQGAVFVPLAGVSTAQFSAPGDCGRRSICPHRATFPPQEQLRFLLYQQECLLVLDNYEHLLPEIDLLVEILSYAPHVTLLVTSRERLALQAEHLRELAGLRLSPGSQPARSGAAHALPWSELRSGATVLAACAPDTAPLHTQRGGDGGDCAHLPHSAKGCRWRWNWRRRQLRQQSCSRAGGRAGRRGGDTGRGPARSAATPPLDPGGLRAFVALALRERSRRSALRSSLSFGVVFWSEAAQEVAHAHADCCWRR
jgi:hypothetical protein